MNCKYCGKLLKPNGKSHELYCKLNPNHKLLTGKNNPMFGKKGKNQYSDGKIKMSQETKDKIRDMKKGIPLLDNHKLKISDSLKIAHKEKRAWNIGKSRWNNEPSYPEKFFMRVIENEFSDKDYEREYSIGIYSIDFAWKHKKLGIEIDGE